MIHHGVVPPSTFVVGQRVVAVPLARALRLSSASGDPKYRACAVVTHSSGAESAPELPVDRTPLPSEKLALARRFSCTELGLRARYMRMET